MWSRIADSTKPSTAKPASISTKTVDLGRVRERRHWRDADLRQGRRRRVLASAPRQPHQPSMDRQAERQIQRGEHHIDLAPATAARAAGGERPEQRRGEAGNQREMRDAALRADGADLDDRNEGGGVEHEARCQLHRDAAPPQSRCGPGASSAGQQRKRRGDRADRHQRGRRRTCRPSARRSAQAGRREAATPKGGEHPLLRQPKSPAIAGARMLKL